MKRNLVILLIFNVLWTACQSQTNSSSPKNSAPNTSTQQNSGVMKNVNVAEFKAKMGKPNTVVLDVRTPQETAQGKIAGAVELNYNSSNFQNELAKLDKNKTYLVYCAVGGRSGSACQMMSKMGFREVYNLSGGYTAWSSQ